MLRLAEACYIDGATERQARHMNCTYTPLRVSDVSEPWYARLPVFASYESMGTSEWKPYLLHVYGRNVAFPIDMRCFTFFYMEKLPRTWRRVFEARFKPDNSTHFHDGDVVTAYGRRAHVNIYRYAHHAVGLPNVPHFQSNQRIEVFHYGTDCVKPRTPVGYWMMFSPGSGIFFDLKTTLSFDDGYSSACRHFRGSEALCSRCCTPVHEYIIRSARKQRIDSIQIRGSRPGGLKLRRFELFSVNSDCDAHKGGNDRGACPRDGDLIRVDGSACACDPTKAHVNCM